MTPMKRTTTDRQADADTRKRDPQIRSLTLPGLVSAPPMPAWLRKFFQRKKARESNIPA
jgi:hypothetical protein